MTARQYLNWKNVRVKHNKKRRGRVVNGHLIITVDRIAEYKERLSIHNKYA